MKQSVTVGAQLLWSGRYGCNNGRYGCTIVMSYIEINKAVSQWLLTFNLCVSVTWPLTCAFHIPCTHTPEIIDMHRGICDKTSKWIVVVECPMIWDTVPLILLVKTILNRTNKSQNGDSRIIGITFMKLFKYTIHVNMNRHGVEQQISWLPEIRRPSLS